MGRVVSAGRTRRPAETAYTRTGATGETGATAAIGARGDESERVDVGALDVKPTAAELAVARLQAELAAAPEPEIAEVEIRPDPDDALAARVAALEQRSDDTVAREALDVLRVFAGRPDPPASPITIHLPSQDVHVGPPSVTVELPEQPAPVVHVAAAEPAAAPVVNVTLPDTHVDVQVDAPQVDVHVPPQTAAHRRVKVEFDASGNKSYVVADEGE